MLAALRQLHQECGDYDEASWPLPVVLAWQAVRSGNPAVDAASSLWPHYLDQVQDWLTWVGTLCLGSAPNGSHQRTPTCPQPSL